MEIKDKFFIITKGKMYLKESASRFIVKFGTSGKPQLFGTKKQAQDRAIQLGVLKDLQTIKKVSFNIV